MNWIRSLILAVALGLFFYWARTAGKKPARVEARTGELILDHGWVLKGLGLVTGAFLPLGILILWLLSPPRAAAESGAIAAMLLFFILLGGFLILEAFMVRIQLAASGITGRSPWRAPRAFAWSEVAEVRYSSINMWFVIEGPEGKLIRLSLLLAGAKALIPFLREHLDPARYEKARRGIQLLES